MMTLWFLRWPLYHLMVVVGQAKVLCGLQWYVTGALIRQLILWHCLLSQWTFCFHSIEKGKWCSCQISVSVKSSVGQWLTTLKWLSFSLGSVNSFAHKYQGSSGFFLIYKLLQCADGRSCLGQQYSTVVTSGLWHWGIASRNDHRNQFPSRVKFIHSFSWPVAIC